MRCVNTRLWKSEQSQEAEAYGPRLRPRIGESSILAALPHTPHAGTDSPRTATSLHPSAARPRPSAHPSLRPCPCTPSWRWSWTTACSCPPPCPAARALALPLLSLILRPALSCCESGLQRLTYSQGKENTQLREIENSWVKEEQAEDALSFPSSPLQ